MSPTDADNAEEHSASLRQRLRPARDERKHVIEHDKVVKEERPTHAWHSSRRAKLVQDPQVRALISECAGNQEMEVCIGMAICIALVIVHSIIATYIQTNNANWSWTKLSIIMLLASATVGAQCAFVLQALNHELGHATQALGTAKPLHKALSWMAFAFCTAGSALCHIPWVAYYFGQGHRRHHQMAGSQYDVDADALFWLWVPPKDCKAITRFVWITLASPTVPFAYWASLLYFASLDIKNNIWELRLVTMDLIFSMIAMYTVGWWGAVYFVVSSWFSMGFLCHPHVTFWILQHVCCDGSSQPTVSYYGNWLWNILSLNELLHVEHHDLSRLGWRHMGKLRKLKPELYEPLYAQQSILTLIWQWLNAEPGPHGLQWDFGCRHTWGYDLPGGWAVGEICVYVGQNLQLNDGSMLRRMTSGEVVGRDETGDNNFVRVEFMGFAEPLSVNWGVLARP